MAVYIDNNKIINAYINGELVEHGYLGGVKVFDLSSFDPVMCNMYVVSAETPGGHVYSFSSNNIHNAVKEALDTNTFNDPNHYIKINTDTPNGDAKLTNLSHLFHYDPNNENGGTNFAKSNFIGHLVLNTMNTSEVKDMSYLFALTSNVLNTAARMRYYTDISVDNWDTSKVTNMASLFEGSLNIVINNTDTTSTLNLSNWNTSNVTNMSRMFSNITINLKSLSWENWNTTVNLPFDTSNVKDMSYMFYNIAVNGQILETNPIYFNLQSFNFSNVTNLAYFLTTFGCRTPNDFYIAMYNYYPFDKNSFKGILDTKNVENFSHAFCHNSSSLSNLNENNIIPISNIIISNKATDLSSLFEGSIWGWAGNENDLILNWDVSNVKFADNTFATCFLNAMNTVGWNTNNMVDISYMFFNCSNLKIIKGIDKWNTSSVTSFKSLFFNCRNLTDLNISNWNTNKVTDMSNMFYECANLTSLNLSNWNVANVTNMEGMFQWCSNIKDFNFINNWKINSSLNSLTQMFYWCEYADRINLYPFTQSSIYINSMNNMCSHAQYRLMHIDHLENLKVNYCKNFAYAFCNTRLETINVSWKNTSNMTVIYSMFNDSFYLKNIEGIENWNVSNINNMAYAFSDCPQLTTLNLKWDSNTYISTNINVYHMFQNTNNLSSMSFNYIANAIPKYSSVSGMDNASNEMHYLGISIQNSNVNANLGNPARKIMRDKGWNIANK